MFKIILNSSWKEDKYLTLSWYSNLYTDTVMQKSLLTSCIPHLMIIVNVLNFVFSGSNYLLLNSFILMVLLSFYELTLFCREYLVRGTFAWRVPQTRSQWSVLVHLMTMQTTTQPQQLWRAVTKCGRSIYSRERTSREGTDFNLSSCIIPMLLVII